MEKLKKGIIFIDFEASGLEDSYPIEVGMVGDNDYSYNSYIKPIKDWTNNLIWSLEAEKIHQIKEYKLFRLGSEVRDVANEIANVALTNDLYSDNGYFDDRWCNTLFEAAGIKKEFVISDIYYLGHSRNTYFHIKFIFFELIKFGVINDEQSFINYMIDNKDNDIIEIIEKGQLIRKYDNNIKAHEALSDAVACKSVINAMNALNNLK